jgi:hypothetical protein
MRTAVYLLTTGFGSHQGPAHVVALSAREVISGCLAQLAKK